MSEQKSMKQIHVPDDFIIYRCKISGGQIIDIALPPALKAEDVKRLCAFLRTQTDESPDENQKPISGRELRF